MSRNVTHVAVPPEKVFDVLRDPRSYGHWVVGSRKIRDADPGFPAPGTKFHHQQGFGPLRLNDETEVVESAPPHRLVLHAKFRPFGTQVVTMEIAPEGGGSRVTMLEGPGDAFTRLIFNPLLDALLKRRNDESLRRFKEMAEGRGPSMADAGTPSETPA